MACSRKESSEMVFLNVIESKDIFVGLKGVSTLLNLKISRVGMTTCQFMK